jgi:opacity protein-like surface antigen
MSYDVTPQFTVDLAYRYLDIGDISSGQVTAWDNSGSYAEHVIQDVTSHDLMLNMRYRLEHKADYPMVMK